LSDVSVRVRISDFVGDPRYAICVERPDQLTWVVDVDVARKLHRDLGEALDAVERLTPFDGIPAVTVELAGEGGR
jgi:hypothetical protein